MVVKSFTGGPLRNQMEDTNSKMLQSGAVAACVLYNQIEDE
jgi:hypothetical protein